MNDFKPRSGKNAVRTLLYGVAAVLSVVLIRSWGFFLIFAALTAANAYLTYKSKQNEEAYLRKMEEAQEIFGEDMTEEEKRKLFPFEKSEKAKGKEQLARLLKSYAAEDAEIDAYIEAENADDEYEYEYEGEDDEQ